MLRRDLKLTLTVVTNVLLVVETALILVSEVMSEVSVIVATLVIVELVGVTSFVDCLTVGVAVWSVVFGGTVTVSMATLTDDVAVLAKVFTVAAGEAEVLPEDVFGTSIAVVFDVVELVNVSTVVVGESELFWINVGVSVVNASVVVWDDGLVDVTVVIGESSIVIVCSSIMPATLNLGVGFTEVFVAFPKVIRDVVGPTLVIVESLVDEVFLASAVVASLVCEVVVTPFFVVLTSVMKYSLVIVVATCTNLLVGFTEVVPDAVAVTATVGALTKVLEASAVAFAPKAVFSAVVFRTFVDSTVVVVKYLLVLVCATEVVVASPEVVLA